MTTYLDKRVERYNKFQDILDRPLSTQCGRQFKLQLDDGSVITPDLKGLGAGVYGLALAVEDPALKAIGINAVIKLADSTNSENMDEIKFGYIASELVKKGLTPNLPLYTYCKRPVVGGLDIPENCNCGTSHQGCDFERSDTNPTGNFIIFPSNLKREAKINYDIRKERNCLVSFSEKLDGSFKSFLKDVVKDNNDNNDLIRGDWWWGKDDRILNNNLKFDQEMKSHLLSLFAQTMFGLKTMSDTDGNGCWVHLDLHHDNILYRKDIMQPDKNPKESKEYLKYFTGETTYAAFKHNNILWVLWDFGKVQNVKEGGHIQPKNLANVGGHTTPYALNKYYEWLDRHFHLSDRNYFNPPITVNDVKKWVVSYYYDMARLFVSIYNDLILTPHIMQRSAQLCRTLFIVFIKKLNDPLISDIEKSSVDPLTFMNVFLSPPIDTMREAWEWSNMFKSINIPENKILKTYYVNSQVAGAVIAKKEALRQQKSQQWKVKAALAAVGLLTAGYTVKKVYDMMYGGFSFGKKRTKKSPKKTVTKKTISPKKTVTKKTSPKKKTLSKKTISPKKIKKSPKKTVSPKNKKY